MRSSGKSFLIDELAIGYTDSYALTLTTDVNTDGYPYSSII